MPIIDKVNDQLYAFEVVPYHLRLAQFKETLMYMISPGFEQFGIDTRPLMTWLEARLKGS